MSEVKEQELIENIDINTPPTISSNKVEDAYSKNKNVVNIVIGSVIAVIGGYFAYQNFVIKPKEIEAKTMVWRAEKYFEKDSFNLALNGDGQNLGFLNIIEDYGNTNTGNIANCYAGLCYLHMGDYANAIEYLGSYDGNDPILTPIVYGATADAYVELNDYDQALQLYKKAYSEKNNFSSPKYLAKAALVYDVKGQYNDALDLYNKIKNDYPESNEARNAEKYIAKYELLAKK